MLGIEGKKSCRKFFGLVAYALNQKRIRFFFCISFGWHNDPHADGFRVRVYNLSPSARLLSSRHQDSIFMDLFSFILLPASSIIFRILKCTRRSISNDETHIPFVLLSLILMISLVSLTYRFDRKRFFVTLTFNIQRELER